MANTDAAFGLKAIGKVGQNRDNQGLSEYSIAANASAIYQRDLVEMVCGQPRDGSRDCGHGSLFWRYWTDPACDLVNQRGRLESVVDLAWVWGRAFDLPCCLSDAKDARRLRAASRWSKRTADS